MTDLYKVGPLMITLAVTFIFLTISHKNWYVEGDFAKNQVSGPYDFWSNSRRIINYLLSLWMENGGFKLSFILNSDVETYFQGGQHVRTSSFQVPKHVKKAMENKFHRLMLQPVIDDYSKEISYTLSYFENNLFLKYPNFLHYLNKEISLALQKIPRKIRITLMSDGQPLLLKAILQGAVLAPDIKNKRKNVHAFSLNAQYYSVLRHPSRLASSPFKKHKDEVEEEVNSKVTVRPIRKRRSIETKDEKSTLRLKVRFKLEKPTDSDYIDDKFKRHLKVQLARRMRVPRPSINDINIKSGTDVSFILSTFNDENSAMDDQTVFDAADFLKQEIKQQKLRLTDLNGKLLMTTRSSYVSVDDNQVNLSVVILVVLCITLLMVLILTIVLVYMAKRLSRIPKTSSEDRNKAYRDIGFGRDSSQSVGKYSLDSGLWLGPGPEPTFTVPDAPYYRPPTVDQIASTPRPITAVRTRLKQNWNVDERALSTIPDDHGRRYVRRESNFH